MKIHFPNSLLNFTGIKFLPKSMRDFCIDIVKTTVEERERNHIVRKDLMQSMIQLRNNNKIENSDELKLDASGMNIESYGNMTFKLNLCVHSLKIDDVRANSSTSFRLLYRGNRVDKFHHFIYTS